jgi:uncharacterized surface protein with fasciclin (FAS1) repeats
MINRRPLLICTAFAVLAAITSITGCASYSKPVTLAQTIAANPQLSTLNSLLSKAGLTETLASSGPFTLFAPNNQAFANVPSKTMDALAADPAKLKAVLTFHVLPGDMRAAQVKNSELATLNGAKVALAKSGAFVTVEEALVVTADIPASNGVIHIIDGVLIPPHKK